MYTFPSHMLFCTQEVISLYLPQGWFTPECGVGRVHVSRTEGDLTDLHVGANALLTAPQKQITAQ